MHPHFTLIKAFDSSFEIPGFLSLVFTLCAGGQATPTWPGVTSEKLCWTGAVFICLAEGGPLSSKEHT